MTMFPTTSFFQTHTHFYTGKGEAAAVVALETYQGFLCRSFTENGTLAEVVNSTETTNNTTDSTIAYIRGSSVGLCVLARPETKQQQNPAYIFSFKSANVTVAAGKYNETVHSDRIKRVLVNVLSIGIEHIYYTGKLVKIQGSW